ncbi:methyl-accepting chemotaxis protein [Litchfieldia salsa]|uniref:Methyl-accepting chemotaxis protein n=1 Tax=Litchfieldia salsa TaxID=930152 RepID=A0A1H0PT98_9BACI|nr:methyl-accepting chemotaxis protein [Litchfieldia salsa]SDP08372.1 methyl-accepting chemotaxis protein [Litchfieldia salsa]
MRNITNYWSRKSIGIKYSFVFAMVMLLFILSVSITYWLLANTNESIEKTKTQNEIVIEVSELLSIYQEKYLHIPEYIIAEDRERLLHYISSSEAFVESANSIRQRLNTEEQIEIFNQIIENNHMLDQYFFSMIVPNVQEINTELFLELQADANTMKEDTMTLANQLKQEAVSTNRTFIETAQHNIDETNATLLISVAVSLFISIALIFFISRSIRKSLNQVIQASDAIANGNLSVEDLVDNQSNDIGKLSVSINHMKISLKEMILEISELAANVNEQVSSFLHTSDDVRKGSEQVAITVEELANGATNQADEAGNISEKTREFHHKIMDANNHGEKLVTFSQEVLTVSIDGDQQMKQSLEQMDIITNTVKKSVAKINDVEKQTDAISEFVKIIQTIASQTNLLALNASIEAARAGEAGKSFAVVADEVRKLAEEVGASSKSITVLVDTINKEISSMSEELSIGYSEVNKGKQQIETSGQYFYDIKEKVSIMSKRVDDISNTLIYLGESSNSINMSVEHIAAISEESAAGSEEISASAIEQRNSMEQVSEGLTQLQQSVERMNTLISRFDV